MKKISLIIFISFISIVLLQNCKKEQKETVRSNGTLIYKRDVNYIPSKSVFDNHITKIFRLNKNSKEISTLIPILKQKNLFNKLDVNDIKLLYVDNSNAKIYYIKYKSNIKEWLVIYEINGNYIFQKVKKSYSNNLIQLSASDLSDTQLYAIDLNSKNKVGNIKIGKGNILFGSIVNNGLSTKNYSDSCPATTDTFGDCMLCAIHECWDSWACAVAMGIEPELIFGTFATVCAVAQL